MHRVFLIGLGLKERDSEDRLHLRLLTPVVIKLAPWDGSEPELRDLEAERVGYV